MNWTRLLPGALYAAAALFTQPLPADPFAELIRRTDPLAPAAQQKTFHLPPGFEIQLVASEPDISKPMNMAFDSKGRLWITESTEYPFAVPLGSKGRDTIKILEDLDENGRARKITTFAEGLNIPIGLVPYRDGAIAFSIPNISFYRDTTGDGRADAVEKLYGPFGYERDTHGMANSFRRGFDGWMYGCHGFNNITTVAGRDGHTIEMHSGNSYRLRPDGGRIEQFTWGQVNPFGLAFDPWGNLYSADCHSAPIYQLIRRGHYPSFGKPHDGLGFAPAMMTHSHGSTAIAGIVFYAANQFPPEYRRNFFIGNVMTSRVNRDTIVEHGSTWLAQEEPDFLRCEDPWFRPVDLTLGPDGAIYVADFYNRIIGHYEVPLDHPGRDRERGRIWRIVYRGDNATAAETEFDLSRAGVGELIERLGHANLAIRMAALNEISDRIGEEAASPLKEALRRPANAFQTAHALWALFRLDALDGQILGRAAADEDTLVRVHAMRILSELPRWNIELRDLARAGLDDESPLVRRQAADALGQHPSPDHLRPLLSARHAVPAEDPFLLHTIRIALRNCLENEEAFSHLPWAGWAEADARAIADVALGVHTAAAGAFLVSYVRDAEESRDALANYLRHAARYAPETELDGLAQLAQARFSGDLEFQLALLNSVREGAGQRGVPLPEAVRVWGANLVAGLLASIDPDSLEWFYTPMEGAADQNNPWFVQRRASADGDRDSRFLSSLPPGGESLTGTLRSKSFIVPDEISFFLAGHDGFPDRPAQKKNVVRLRDSESGEILAETHPSRNDLAQPVKWDLSAHAGKKAFIELVDGDTAHAYAWLAAGRFSPPVVSMPPVDPSAVSRRLQSAAELAGRFGVRAMESQLAALLIESRLEPAVRGAILNALFALAPETHLGAAIQMLNAHETPIGLREQAAQILGGRNAPAARMALVETLRVAPRRLDSRIALALAGQREGAEALLEAVGQGHASPYLLQDRSIRERLLAAGVHNASERIESLTRSLPPPDATREKLMAQRAAAFDPATASISRGAQVYAANCAACHRIGGEGGLIGPQLDGIGHRGLQRLIEDILDPNRSVDVGFRYSTITLQDDQIITGLFRREEGQLLVFADATGREISIPRQDIVERLESEWSLMPDNYDEILIGEAFNDLLAFLLSTR